MGHGIEVGLGEVRGQSLMSLLGAPVVPQEEMEHSWLEMGDAEVQVSL